MHPELETLYNIMDFAIKLHESCRTGDSGLFIPETDLSADVPCETPRFIAIEPTPEPVLTYPRDLYFRYKREQFLAKAQGIYRQFTAPQLFLCTRIRKSSKVQTKDPKVIAGQR